MLQTRQAPPDSLAPLHALASRLRCEPGWQPLAPDSLPGAGLLGQRGDLPCIGILSENPGGAARRMARQLLRRGETALVLAASPAGDESALSVAFQGTPVLRVEPAEDPGLVAESLERLAGLPGEGLLASAARAAEILATRGVGARFFEAFEARIEATAATLTLRRPEDRRDLALLQLNRVLFLYFIQSKGWLDGQPDFLRDQVDRCLVRGKSLDRQLLRPLFFGSLNREPARRSAVARGFGAIPFLNGGLFEPHPLERSWKGTIPNRTWRDTFDGLFECFRFTAAEGRPGAVAPDMLGRVFEGLMAPEERRSSGTFYTPPSLVQALLEESLAAMLANRLGVHPDEALHLLATRDPVLRPLVRGLRLLDPAVGSGAFLLVALERFTALAAGDDPRERQAARRQVLRTALFGVDINPTAVRLTELRLWLALIADDPAIGSEAVEPLPNLDCLVRQGDSLTDPLGLVARMPFLAGAAGNTLATLRLAVTGATGAAKRDAARALRKAEQVAMRACLGLAECRLQEEFAETLLEARSPDLFGRVRGADRVIRRRLKETRSRLAPVRQARRRLDQSGEVGWFQYEAHFADLFQERGGFDLVVGNPPWVRAEKLGRAVREQLASRYSWWKSGTGGAGYGHQPDLAVAFLERAHELARDGGVVGLLVPAKLATAGYGAAARASLTEGATVHAACEIPKAQGSFDATVYPLALVTGKRAAPRAHQVRLELARPGGRTVPQAALDGGPWVLRGANAADVLRRLSATFPPISPRHRIQLGAKTGANEIFLRPPESVEPGLVRPAIRGRDIGPFTVSSTVPMLWPCAAGGEPLQSLPPGAARFLRAHQERLLTRADYRQGPPWTIFRTAGVAGDTRVVWADLARRLAATMLSPGDPAIPLNTCYLLRASPAEGLALTAWLNCSWMRGAARYRADPASGGFARFNARTVGSLPLPPSLAGDARLLHCAGEALAGRLDQAELDDLTAPHLQLDDSDLAVLAELA